MCIFIHESLPQCNLRNWYSGRNLLTFFCAYIVADPIQRYKQRTKQKSKEFVIVVCVYLLCSNIFISYQVVDHHCNETCNCCIERECHETQGFTNACTNGCIDGHRGLRCYELCKYTNCKSCGGNTNSYECTECKDGYYLGQNKDCLSQCPSNCKTCTSSTYCTQCKEGSYGGLLDGNGSKTCCPTNCECNGGHGDCVSCKRGYFGTSTSCAKHCPNKCITCESDTLCNVCKNGFYNGYKYDDNKYLQLLNCTYACRDTCTQCQSYNNCLQCIEGKYGSTCQENCSVGCKVGSCRVDSGKCTCSFDFTGDKCMKCANGKYGALCKQACSKYCKDTICDRMSGDCSVGCINENISGNTCNTCIAGMFGELCDITCPKNCKGSGCERFSGICSDGCTQNFNGTHCDMCIHGKYGNNCELKCPANCAVNGCDRHSGTCFDCVEHFQGNTCNECKLGYYSQNCDMPCSHHCTNFSCNRDNGSCTNGCMDGFSGDKCCVMSQNCVECKTKAECKTCAPGYFKKSCNDICQGGCKSCDILTGECIPGKGRCIFILNLFLVP